MVPHFSSQLDLGIVTPLLYLGLPANEKALTGQPAVLDRLHPSLTRSPDSFHLVTALWAVAVRWGSARQVSQRTPKHGARPLPWWRSVRGARLNRSCGDAHPLPTPFG